MLQQGSHVTSLWTFRPCQSISHICSLQLSQVCTGEKMGRAPRTARIFFPYITDTFTSVRLHCWVAGTACWLWWEMRWENANESGNKFWTTAKKISVPIWFIVVKYLEISVGSLPFVIIPANHMDSLADIRGQSCLMIKCFLWWL